MIMVWKSTFVGMALMAVPLGAMAQEPLSRDTIRTELSSDFIKQIGDYYHRRHYAECRNYASLFAVHDFSPVRSP